MNAGKEGVHVQSQCSQMGPGKDCGSNVPIETNK